jgi:hypothetical protein
MYGRETDLLFPMRVAPSLRELRNADWMKIVDQASRASDASREQLGFSLLLIRLSGCLTCHPSSYRAKRGCEICAMQSVRCFRGDDRDLLDLYMAAEREIVDYINRIGLRTDKLGDHATEDLDG